MRRIGSLFVLMLLFLPVAVFAQTLADSTVTVATTETGPTLLDQIASMLTALTPLMVVLVGSGLVAKYLPFAQKLPNFLIPFLNAVIAFLAVFAGPAPAHAGFIGDFVHSLSGPAKMVGSLFLAGVASSIYETFLRGPLEKFGIYRAGLTASEKATKAKMVAAG